MTLTGQRRVNNARAKRVELGDEHIVAGKGVTLGWQSIECCRDIDDMLALDQAQTTTIKTT
jgi:hypothetical protein